MVASDDIAFFIHTQATVSIAVISKTDVQPLFNHEFLQAFDVGRASVIIDIRTVGLCIDDIGICTQRIKHRLSDIPGTAVGAVQTNLDALERVDTQRDQIAHVAVAAGHIVHSAANVLPVSEGQLRPILVEHMQLAVNVILDKQQGLFRHLLAVAVDQLDAVVIVRIVAGGDHDTAIKVIHTGDISHRRRGSDVQQIGVCTRGGQACDQTILEHIRAAAGVLADYNACRLVVAIALAQGIIVPA